MIGQFFSRGQASIIQSGSSTVINLLNLLSDNKPAIFLLLLSYLTQQVAAEWDCEVFCEVDSTGATQCGTRCSF